MTQGFARQLAEDLPPEDVQHILTVFAGDLERLSAILSVTTEAEVMRRTAHALAGAAGAVGAAGLEVACRALRKAPDPASAGALRAALATEVVVARAACQGLGISLPSWVDG